jgi:hypothetical protein
MTLRSQQTKKGAVRRRLQTADKPVDFFGGFCF